jgi:hypothetical protein
MPSGRPRSTHRVVRSRPPLCPAGGCRRNSVDVLPPVDQVVQLQRLGQVTVRKQPCTESWMICRDGAPQIIQDLHSCRNSPFVSGVSRRASSVPSGCSATRPRGISVGASSCRSRMVSLSARGRVKNRMHAAVVIGTARPMTAKRSSRARRNTTVPTATFAPTSTTTGTNARRTAERRTHAIKRRYGSLGSADLVTAGLLRSQPARGCSDSVGS